MTPAEKQALGAAKTPKVAKAVPIKVAPVKATPTPSEPEFTDLGSFTRWSSQQYQNLLRSQQQQQEALFGRYTAASRAQEPLAGAYTRLGAEAGIPELETTIGGFKTNIARLQNMLSGLEANITERTQGQDVSEAQRQRILASEQAPLTRQLGELGTSMSPFVEQLSGSQQKIATQLGLMDRDQQKALQPLIMQIDQISDRFSREITMYTSQKETQLTALLDKIQRQREVEDRDWQLAQQLAAEEREWARRKEEIAMKATSGGIPGLQDLIDLGGRQTQETMGRGRTFAPFTATPPVSGMDLLREMPSATGRVSERLFRGASYLSPLTAGARSILSGIRTRGKKWW